MWVISRKEGDDCGRVDGFINENVALLKEIFKKFINLTTLNRFCMKKFLKN